jgi:hypothetical protein
MMLERIKEDKRKPLEDIVNIKGLSGTRENKASTTRLYL